MIHARDDYNRIQDPAGLIPADEPVFLLRAQDELACKAVAYYAELCEQAQAAEVAAKARAHSDRMAAWPKKKVPDITPAAPCPNAERMGEHACSNRAQCWEPCGELGNDERFVKVAPPETAAAIDRVLGLSAGDTPDPALDIPLPCDVKVGGATFRKGVSLATFVGAAQRWHREAFPDGYELTPEQKAANLAILQGAPGTLATAPSKKGALQRIAEQLEDGEGQSLTELLERDAFNRRFLTDADVEHLRAIIRWVFVEEAELRPAFGGGEAANDASAGRTPNEQRLQRIQQQLIERGCTSIGVTWAEGAEGLDREARAGALADFMEAWLQGKSTPVYFLRDDLLTGEQLVERVRLLEGQIKTVTDGIERSEEGLLAYLEGQMFHRSASHVPPDFRDGYNSALKTVSERVQDEKRMRVLAAEVRAFPQGSGVQTQ